MVAIITEEKIEEVNLLADESPETVITGLD